MSPLVDAHAHLGGEREMLARKDILTVMCATEPESAKRVLSLAGERVIASCALHPWNAETCTLEDMIPFIQSAPVLGEIGLDCVWTDADMDAQRRIFTSQLELAARWNKPIVLHTKGMEKEIARTIEPYPVRKLVHWYSCMDDLDDYLAQDCYFTVGPDHAANPAVRQVMARAPIDRLLTETDGMSAVSWAIGREAAPEEVGCVLQGELDAIARAKDLTPEAAREIVYNNLMRFIYGK